MIKINDTISCIESTDHPLSADIGIIKTGHAVWLYDVGNGEKALSSLNGPYNVVLSHFHADHIGNIGKILIHNLYVSKITYNHLPKDLIKEGTANIVCDPVVLDRLRIFPLPSSHAKGSIALEIDNTYTFVGDALYGKIKNNHYVYNAQLLKDEIEILKSLRSPFLLVSHLKGLVRKKENVIQELEAIYQMRIPNQPEILIQKETD